MSEEMTHTTPPKGVMSWLVTPIFILVFFSILLVFHPIIVICHAFSPKASKYALDRMNLSILLAIRYIAGTTFHVRIHGNLPKGEPLVFVSNHQSMYDICLIMWNLRQYKVNFISKKELGRWFPSISFALRNMGSVLIDRNDRIRSVERIEQMGGSLGPDVAACIFPEGTRGRTGELRPFKAAGFAALTKNAPNARIVPIAIRGSWELLAFNLLPIPYGRNVYLDVFPPIDPKSSPKETLRSAERIVRMTVQGERINQGPPKEGTVEESSAI